MGKGKKKRKGTHSSGSPRAAKLARDLVEAAYEFHRLRPWDHFDADDCYGLRLPGEDDLVVACLMGQGGQEFGLCLYRGPDAVAEVYATTEEGAEPDESRTSLLSMSMQPLWDVDPGMRRTLDLAGIHARRETVVPMFLCKKPGLQLREPTPTEMQTLLHAIRGTTLAFSRGELVARPMGARWNFPVLVLSGTPREPTFETTRERLESHLTRPARVIPVASVPADLPRLPDTWCVGWSKWPVRIEGDEREVRLLVVLDASHDHILMAGPTMGADEQTAVRHVQEALRGQNSLGLRGLPAALVFDHRAVFEALSPALQARGIDCRLDPEYGPLAEVMESLLQAETEREPAPLTQAVPAADDLVGWKRIEHSLVDLVLQEVRRSKRDGQRAAARFVGDAARADEVLEVNEPGSIQSAFLEWLAFEDRPTERSRTLAERLEERSLPPAHRQLLEHRLRGWASLFRVRHVEPGEFLDLRDLLVDSEVRVHDFALSECLRVGDAVGLRVFVAGDFHFASVLGPAIPALQIPAALEFLHQEFDLAGGRDQAATGTQIARLWAWSTDQEPPGLPALRNTDGEELWSFQTAYHLDDPDAVAAALDALPELHPDEANDSWVRVREQDHTLLGQLQILGDELLTECHSKERNDGLRALVERIPGVHWQSVTKRSMADLEDGPEDDRSPPRPRTPPSPDALQAVQAFMEQQCMKWLDESIPALGHKTPREACRTAEGRRRVEGLIRAWPDQDGITIPRERMRKELGLAGRGHGG